MKPVPASAIFVESGNVVYHVTNWQQRRTTAKAKALLIKLGRRHLQRYLHMKAQGRSQKSIYYYVFGTVARRRTAAAPKLPAGRSDIIVAVPLGMLSSDQLLGLIQARVGKGIAGLRDAPIADLRKLAIALGAGSRTGPGDG